jgi:hypothetical protein
MVCALSMYELTSTYGDLGFWFFARSRLLLGVGLPLIFLPIMAASDDGIPRTKTDDASALMNAARNTGGSIGISIVSNQTPTCHHPVHHAPTELLPGAPRRNPDATMDHERHARRGSAVRLRRVDQHRHGAQQRL